MDDCTDIKLELASCWRQMQRMENVLQENDAEIKKLRDACELALSYFEAMWKWAGNHPASEYADYVEDLREALREETE